MRFVMSIALTLALVGCAKDPAKVLEAKSMAVCGCENIKCVQAVNKRFADQKQTLDTVTATPEQQARAKLAGEKLRICLERIAKAAP